MLTLYDLPLSPYAQKVKLGLLEKGIEFTCRQVDLWNPDDDFLSVSPRRQAPVLVDGELAVFDSTIIVEYLEDRWPEPHRLRPPTPAALARARMIEDVCDTSYDAINWGVMEVTVFKRASGRQAEQMLATARAQVSRLNRWLEAQLGEEEWFHGDRPGWADLCVYPYVNGAASQGNRPAAGGALHDWLTRMRGRASAERLREDIRSSLQGERPLRRWRTYRDHRLEWMLRSGGREIVERGLDDGSIRFTAEVSWRA